ncbi:hypothetical protein ONZ45_g2510 [Pleurotus djamor]|nr:hypothetical protein ONZ45_g2510 [Pleurotus djamor]
MQETPPSDGGYSHTVRPQTNPEPPPRPLGRSATLQSLTNSSVAESSKLGSGSGSQRRGTKRPVAADFVDFDNSEGQNRRAEWNPPVPPAQSPKVPHDRAIRRRLTGTNGSIMSSGMGFASVSGMRPCIIDLSDSDDDGTEDRNHLVFRPDARSRYSPALPGARNQRVVGTSGRGTPSTSAPSTGISSQVSSASLLEKEEQIRKMKELIARAEQKQQQKQAITRSASVLPESSRGVTPSVESSVANAVDGQSAVMVDPEAGMSDASTPTEQPPRSQAMDSPMIGPLFFPSSVVLNVN